MQTQHKLKRVSKNALNIFTINFKTKKKNVSRNIYLVKADTKKLKTKIVL